MVTATQTERKPKTRPPVDPPTKTKKFKFRLNSGPHTEQVEVLNDKGEVVLEASGAAMVKDVKYYPGDIIETDVDLNSIYDSEAAAIIGPDGRPKLMPNGEPQMEWRLRKGMPHKFTRIHEGEGQYVPPELLKHQGETLEQFAERMTELARAQKVEAATTGKQSGVDFAATLQAMNIRDLEAHAAQEEIDLSSVPRDKQGNRKKEDLLRVILAAS